MAFDPARAAVSGLARRCSRESLAVAALRLAAVPAVAHRHARLHAARVRREASGRRCARRQRARPRPPARRVRHAACLGRRPAAAARGAQRRRSARLRARDAHRIAARTFGTSFAIWSARRPRRLPPPETVPRLGGGRRQRPRRSRAGRHDQRLPRGGRGPIPTRCSSCGSAPRRRRHPARLDSAAPPHRRAAHRDAGLRRRPAALARRALARSISRTRRASRRSTCAPTRRSIAPGRSRRAAASRRAGAATAARSTTAAAGGSWRRPSTARSTEPASGSSGRPLRRRVRLRPGITSAELRRHAATDASYAPAHPGGGRLHVVARLDARARAAARRGGAT